MERTNLYVLALQLLSLGGSALVGNTRSLAGGDFDVPDLPSSCVPSPRLSNGALCVYGYQCQSKFCCPKLRVCLADYIYAAHNVHDPASIISPAEVRSKVRASEGDKILSIVFANGGACADPWSQTGKCLQSEKGKPLSTWDQTQCGCKEEYMEMYKANNWVNMNENVSCDSIDGGSSGGNNLQNKTIPTNGTSLTRQEETTTQTPVARTNLRTATQMSREGTINQTTLTEKSPLAATKPATNKESNTQTPVATTPPTTTKKYSTDGAMITSTNLLLPVLLIVMSELIMSGLS